ncbi:MAG: hypothetical protein ACRC62_16560 [Microcoleus sp.]
MSNVLKKEEGKRKRDRKGRITHYPLPITRYPLPTINYQHQSRASGDARTTTINHERAGKLALQLLITSERGSSHYNYQSRASGDARTTTINYQRSTIQDAAAIASSNSLKEPTSKNSIMSP